MAVVDFIPRYRSKQGFGWVRSIADKVQIPVVLRNSFQVQCTLRRLAHVAICLTLFGFAHFTMLGFERLQSYLALYLG